MKEKWKMKKANIESIVLLPVSVACESFLWLPASSFDSGSSVGTAKGKKKKKKNIYFLDIIQTPKPQNKNMDLNMDLESETRIIAK